MPTRDAPARLRLLMDYMKLVHGEEPTFGEVQEFLAGRGVKIGRARWSYILNGHRPLQKSELIDGLAEFFGVPASFITDGEPMPECIAARMDELRALRAEQVRTYAARSLGDISPEAVAEIARVLDESTETPLSDQ